MAKKQESKQKTIDITKKEPLDKTKVEANNKGKKIKEVVKKYNIISYVLIGITVFVSMLIISAQLNTVGNTNVISEGMREAELLSEISKLRRDIEDLTEDYEKSQSVVEEYKTNASTNDILIATMTEDLNKSKLLAGLTDVKGEGVVITIEDSQTIDSDLTIEAGLVHDTDITAILTELKAAGVEAISVNGQRIISTSAIRCVGPTIQVNSVKVASPFYIKAIGNADYLESALNIKGGIVDNLRGYGIIINVERQDDIEINKYDGTIKFKFAEVKE